MHAMPVFPLIAIRILLIILLRLLLQLLLLLLLLLIIIIIIIIIIIAPACCKAKQSNVAGSPPLVQNTAAMGVKIESDVQDVDPKLRRDRL